MARKVILDVDPGIDDAVAMLMALFDPKLDVLAVTAVAGNVSADQATRNVHAVIEQLDPPRWPRVGAASEPDHGLPATTAHIFGADGLGNAHLAVAEPHQRHASDKVIVDLVRAAPEEVTIVALGPLTNIARAFQRDPQLPSMIGQLVIMGGTFEGPGNVTAAAEFNMFCDPRSARAVFHAPITKTLVPLDVTRQVVFTYDLLNQLPDESTTVGRFLRRVLPFAFRSHRQHLGIEGLYLHDAVGLLMAIDRSIFVTHAVAGDVETGGELTMGATIFDRRTVPDGRPNMDVAIEIDVARASAEIIRRLQEAAHIE